MAHAEVPHEKHTPPSTPQLVRVVLVMQVVPPLQQPLQPLSWSHTHAPPRHRSPAPQGGFAPHLHTPLVHRLAFCGSHAVHVVLALVPQVERLCAVQMLFTQHPFGQLLVSQWHEPMEQD